jgi:TetR/AcrR family transcriptional regulator, transcriptional repressor for nem operon
MEDLVTGMGINRASLYDTFGDKKQLFLKILAYYQNQSNRNIQAVMALKKPSPKAQLIAFAEFLMDESLESQEPRGCLLANATSEMALLDPDICQFVTNNVHSFEKTSVPFPKPNPMRPKCGRVWRWRCRFWDKCTPSVFSPFF